MFTAQGTLLDSSKFVILRLGAFDLFVIRVPSSWVLEKSSGTTFFELIVIKESEGQLPLYEAQRIHEETLVEERSCFFVRNILSQM